MADVNMNESTEAVLKEIQQFGAESKKNFEELNKETTELRSLLDAVDGKIEGTVADHVKKLTEAIAIRQDAMDQASTAATERLDQLETTLKRAPLSGEAATPEQLKESKEFEASLLAVQGRKLQPGTRIEPNAERLVAYKEAYPTFLRYGLNPTDEKSLSVGVEADGGVLVTPAMSAKIITKLWESDPIRQLANIETITTDALEWIVDWDEAACGWVGEIQTRSESDTPQWAKKKITVHEMYAEPRATQKLLEDAGINIESWLAGKVADKFNRTEAAAFVTGDGIGKPRGFLTYSTGTTYSTIQQVNMGNASALTSDGFTKVMFALVEQYLGRGTWLMNRTTVRDAMLLKDGDGQYLWRPGLQPGMPSIILGLPVRMSTTMPAVASDALSVVIADWGEAYTIVDRLGITVMRDPFTAKPFVKFYTRKRVGGDVTNPQAMKIGKIAA